MSPDSPMKRPIQCATKAGRVPATEIDIPTPRGRFVARIAGSAGGPVVLLMHGFSDDASTFDALAAAGHEAVAPTPAGTPRPSSTRSRRRPVRHPRPGRGNCRDARPGPVGAAGRSRQRGVRRLRCDGNSAGRRAGRGDARGRAPSGRVRQHPAVAPAVVAEPLCDVLSTAKPERAGGGGERLRLPAAAWRRWFPGWEPPDGHLARVKAILRASGPGRRSSTTGSCRSAAIRCPSRPPPCSSAGPPTGASGRVCARGQERSFAAGFREQPLADVGHFPQLERPAEVSRLVHDWLAAHP